MSKKYRFRTPFESQHVRKSETLLKILPPHFHHIVLKLWQKLNFQISVLVISDILGLFVIRLTADVEISLRNRKNLPQLMQMELSKNLF